MTNFNSQYFVHTSDESETQMGIATFYQFLCTLTAQCKYSSNDVIAHVRQPDMMIIMMMTRIVDIINNYKPNCHNFKICPLVET